MGSIRTILIWSALAVAVAVPIAAAAASPLLAWRDPVYIAAGFAGVIGLGLMLVQPLLISGFLPGLRGQQARRVHRWIGGALVLVVALHVAGLWITSPPDVIDALLFVSPTPFSVWGVIAMWAIIAITLLVVFRRRLRPHTWRLGHRVLAGVIVVGTVVHAVLIEGTMETMSKVALCVLVIAAAFNALANIAIWGKRTVRRSAAH